MNNNKQHRRRKMKTIIEIFAFEIERKTVDRHNFFDDPTRRTLHKTISNSIEFCLETNFLVSLRNIKSMVILFKDPLVESVGRIDKILVVFYKISIRKGLVSSKSFHFFSFHTKLRGVRPSFRRFFWFTNMIVPSQNAINGFFCKFNKILSFSQSNF